jgi:predicted flap endonuclease-1-like 5' DNA nuclease
MGRDHTLHAGIDGVVVFKRSRNDRRSVSVLPFSTEPVAETVAPVAKTKPASAKATAGKPAAAEATAKPAKPAKPAVEPSEPASAEAMAAEPASAEATAAEPAVEATVAEVPAIDVKPVDVPVQEDPAAEVVAAMAEEPASAEATAGKPAKTPKLDDLKIVEGVGPKIEQLLKDAGIDTWEALAAAPVDRLREILDEAGPRYQMHDPSTWPAQARFAADGKWDELKEYQEMLIGGRNVQD